MTDAEELTRRIAGGHAYQKPVVERAEFPEVSSVYAFASLIARVIASGTATARLKDGRRAYWLEEVQTFVMANPDDCDGGTAFRPIGGRAYFDAFDEEG